MKKGPKHVWHAHFAYQLLMAAEKETKKALKSTRSREATYISVIGEIRMAKEYLVSNVLSRMPRRECPFRKKDLRFGDLLDEENQSEKKETLGGNHEAV